MCHTYARPHFTPTHPVAMGAASTAPSILRGDAFYACRQQYAVLCSLCGEVPVEDESVWRFDP